MRPIDGNVFSHTDPAAAGGAWVPVKQVRTGPGYRVTKYTELARLVAQLGYRNRRFNLLHRGQTADHKSPRTGSSLLIPTIHRPHGVSRKEVDRRFEALREATRLMVQEKTRLGESGPGLFRHWEYQASLLQHYEVLKTPLLDVTSSLRVACSFALPRGDSKEGYLYVLGMPHPHGSISHFVDDDIVLVKLQNVCPPEALRPHYQEGYLVGRLTTMDRLKHTGDNASYRMLAKYKLVNDGSFWGDGFQPIPQEALLPEKDSFGGVLRGMVLREA